CPDLLSRAQALAGPDGCIGLDRHSCSDTPACFQMHAAPDGLARDDAICGMDAVRRRYAAACVQALVAANGRLRHDIQPDKGVALDRQLAPAQQLPCCPDIAPACDVLLGFDAPPGPDVATHLDRAVTAQSAIRTDVLAGDQCLAHANAAARANAPA